MQDMNENFIAPSAGLRAQEETTDLMEDFLSIIYSFAARLYGLRSARRRTNDVAASLGIAPEQVEAAFS